MTLEQINLAIGITMITACYTVLVVLLQKYYKVWRRARRIKKLRRKHERI